MPLAGAVVIGAADLDDNISDWAVREKPLFGNNAADTSDTLLDISTGALVLSAVLAPADSAGDRVRGDVYAENPGAWYVRSIELTPKRREHDSTYRTYITHTIFYDLVPHDIIQYTNV